MEKLTTVDIPSDGKKKTLNLAVRLPEHSSWFAWREDRFFHPLLQEWDLGIN